MVYPGGKNGSGIYQKIINQMPPHRAYIEPFLGSGAVMRLKRPADVSIGVDSDADVVASVKLSGLKTVPGLLVRCDDAISFLKSYAWQGDEMLYCDPPYLGSVRKSQEPIYYHEMMSPGQHIELLRLLKRLPCMVMISGYWSQLYAHELAGWRTIFFQAMTHAGPATEWLWMNYPEPFELHDYRYLGKNFRERERIKRKQLRWRARLARMPALERYALLEAIAASKTSPDPASLENHQK
jgi:DNA adenine methylase